MSDVIFIVISDVMSDVIFIVMSDVMSDVVSESGFNKINKMCWHIKSV